MLDLGDVPERLKKRSHIWTGNSYGRLLARGRLKNGVSRDVEEKENRDARIAIVSTVIREHRGRLDRQTENSEKNMGSSQD